MLLDQSSWRTSLVFAMAVMDGKATTLYDEQYFIDTLRLIPAN